MMIDLAALARNTFNDQGLRAEVLRLFLAQSVELLSRLEATNSASEWKVTAHKLKGSALGIGAEHAAREAGIMEKLLFVEEAAPRFSALLPLRQAIEGTNKEILDLLGLDAS